MQRCGHWDHGFCLAENCSYQIKSLTNFERIKNMTIVEMAQFICGIYDDDTCKYDKFICGTTIPNYDEGGIKQLLESEAE